VIHGQQVAGGQKLEPQSCRTASKPVKPGAIRDPDGGSNIGWTPGGLRAMGISPNKNRDFTSKKWVSEHKRSGYLANSWRAKNWSQQT